MATRPPHPDASSVAHQALLLVDVQRDFCPGGALGAPQGDRILPSVNRHIAEAHAAGTPVYATRDWHPAVTAHFQAYGGEWPVHCVQHTDGAQFHPGMALPSDAIVITKGADPDRDGYSAFDGRTPDGRTLLEDLQERAIDRVLIAGLATDYCVRQTTLDALAAGLKVTVLLDGVAGIDRHAGDVDRALDEMVRAGADLVHDGIRHTERT